MLRLLVTPRHEADGHVLLPAAEPNEEVLSATARDLPRTGSGAPRVGTHTCGMVRAGGMCPLVPRPRDAGAVQVAERRQDRCRPPRLHSERRQERCQPPRPIFEGSQRRLQHCLQHCRRRGRGGSGDRRVERRITRMVVPADAHDGAAGRIARMVVAADAHDGRAGRPSGLPLSRAQRGRWDQPRRDARASLRCGTAEQRYR